MKKYLQLFILLINICSVNNVFGQVISTNLPIIKITTQSAILDEPKVGGNMEVIDNQNKINNIKDLPTAKYLIGVEYRGSTSQSLSLKKPLGIETRNEKGDNLNVGILGLPAENDWVMIAPYSDKSLMRDHLSYTFARAMNRYASRTRYVELILNGSYQGVYILGEKIKQGKNRVDIAKLKETDISGDDLTGGYILKIDKGTGSASRGWNSAYTSGSVTNRFQVEYPKIEVIKDVQFNYIRNIVNDFESRLQSSDFKDLEKGYDKVIDVNSFIDFFLLNELTRNVDGYRLSTYFFKDKDSKNKKLIMGPVWDFNLAFGNADYCDGWKTSGWAFKFNAICPTDGYTVPFWWDKLLQDSNFQIKLKARWNALRNGALADEKIYGQVDSVKNVLKDAQVRNFQQWNIMGRYIWPNYHFTGNYTEEVDWTKNWIKDRIAWLDQSDLLNPKVLANESPDVDMEKPYMYPNPVLDKSKIHFYLTSKTFIKASIADISGKQINTIINQELAIGDYEFDFERKDMAAGIYFFLVEKNSKLAYIQKIIVN